jgi:hypothetical protein
MSVTMHGGSVIPHVNVDAMAYGSTWNQGEPLQNAVQVRSFLSDVTNSPYMDMLGEYGVGRGSLESWNYLWDGPGSGTVTDGNLRYMLMTKWENGYLNTPSSDRLFMIFTAPNVLVQRGNSNSQNNFYGYHDSFSFYWPYYGTTLTFNYAVIAYPGGVNQTLGSLSPFQQMTEVASHELAEGVTDPVLGTAWFDANGQEIGDLINLHYGVLHGYTVQYEWSNNAQAGVLWNDTAHWVAVDQGQVSQMVSSPDGYGNQDIFGIGLNNHVYYHHAGPTAGPYYTFGGWIDIGGYASTLAIGRDADGYNELFEIDKGTGSVNVYSTNTDDWTPLYGGAKALAVGKNINSQLEVFCIGTTNQVYHQWQNSPNGSFNGTWYSIGGSAQSIAVGTEQDGHLDVFARWTDGTTRYIKQVYGSAYWTGPGWVNLGGWAQPGSVNVASNADGRLEVFVIGGDHHVYNSWQSNPNGSFNGFTSANLGGWLSQIAVGKDGDGRLRVVGIGSDGGVYECPQALVGSSSWYAGWFAMGESAQWIGVDFTGREALMVGSGNAANLLALPN